MPDIPPEARVQFGVFTGRQAKGTGWSRSSLAHGVRTGRLIQPRPGTYLEPDQMSGTDPKSLRRHLAIRAAAAVLMNPDCVASHRSSAALAGLPILTTPAQPCVTRSPGHRSAVVGAHVHRAGLVDPEDVVPKLAIARTTSARTVVDIAREVGVDEAVVVADAALERGMTDLDALGRALSRSRNWADNRRAHEAVRRCDGRSESPLETISRLRIEESDLPVPQLQMNIFDLNGLWLARPDFLWEEFGLAGEADGLEKYDGLNPKPWRDEKVRQHRTERTGLRFVRWMDEDLRNLPALVARIRWNLGQGTAVTDRGWTSRPGRGRRL